MWFQVYSIGSSPYPDEFVPKPVMQPFQTILTELRDEDTK